MYFKFKLQNFAYFWTAVKCIVFVATTGKMEQHEEDGGNS